MFTFLRALGLQPIEWSQALRLTGKATPYVGEALNAAFANAAAVVVLLTPDDVAYLHPELQQSDDPDWERMPTAQARPNVLFEAGIAMGRDERRTVLVELGQVRPFSDIYGRHVLRMNNSPERRKELAQRLETAGCAVDIAGADWLSAGDFTSPARIPVGRRLESLDPKRRVSLDARYVHRGGNSYRLEIVNRGTVDVKNLDVVVPEEAKAFTVLRDELPLPLLKAGKSVALMAMALGGGGKNYFDVTLTGETPEGEPVAESVLISLIT